MCMLAGAADYKSGAGWGQTSKGAARNESDPFAPRAGLGVPELCVGSRLSPGTAGSPDRSHRNLRGQDWQEGLRPSWAILTSTLVRKPLDAPAPPGGRTRGAVFCTCSAPMTLVL